MAASKSTLIHFNGASFDIPFIRERFRKLAPDEASDIWSVFEKMQSVDLYQNLRPLKKLYQSDKFTQQTLEQFSGWHRTDRLSGKQMITLYKKYVASQESLLADLLLLHNHDDLLGMIQILPLTNVLIMMQDSTISNNAEIRYISDEETSELTFDFSAFLPFPAPLSRTGKLNNCRYQLEVSGTAGRFTIQAHIGELRYFFPDYKNYYYLPAEDQAIHKSIGNFVDREYRQNAKPFNCYTRKTGVFLPQAAPALHPVFQESYADKTCYFELTDAFLSDQTRLRRYLDLMLSHCLFNK